MQQIPNTCIYLKKIRTSNFNIVLTFVFAGLVNRGDSFRRRHNRSNSVFPSGSGEDNLLNEKQRETLEQLAFSKEVAANSPDSSNVTYNVSVIGATGVGKTSLISQFMTSECINPYDRDRGTYIRDYFFEKKKKIDVSRLMAGELFSRLKVHKRCETSWRVKTTKNFFVAPEVTGVIL